MNKDSLGDRMKDYENVNRYYLQKKIPVIIRIDGKAFHTLTKNMDRPFDESFIQAMQYTTEYLVRNIEGCYFGYQQSDEISLLLTDYTTIKTEAWFDYNIQKLCSISASMATSHFNKMLDDLSPKEANFDARAFNLPKEEVVNYFIWRQNDFTRNSIQMVGISYFSQKQLNGKSCNEIQEMLFQEKNVNYNDYPIYQKRGSCVYYKIEKKDSVNDEFLKRLKIENYKNEIIKSEYVIDKEIPIFTQDRNFIQKFVDIDKLLGD